MSRTVDERIVDMQFNNREFESGIQTSLTSLDKLEKGLKLEGASKGLSELSDAGKRFSLAGIADSVDAISDKFSAFSIASITAIQNITNRVVDLGIQMVKSLTIEPISAGYADYERKLTSVQTIMNATGKDIAVVSGYFDELDKYADLTIYDLSHMTSAFAKFTNAGVDMDKSVPAIKGIANMVALAGQDANAASIAMYNLSQSIAGGFLTTMDYRSLNLANVATKEWKEQMVQGAIAAGTLKKNSQGLYNIKGADKAYNDQQLFTEALSKGWATTEVMLDVLGDYGDINTEIGAKAQAAAQDVKSFSMMMDTLKASVGTSWTDSFELIIGDLEESKELFTALTKVIGGFLDKSADARNEMLQFWKDNGGRTALIDSFKNAFEALSRIITPIKEAFSELFPPLTGQTLLNITNALKEFTDSIKIGDETADKLKRTFKGLFSVVDLVAQGFDLLFDIAGLVFDKLAPGAGTLLDLTAKLGDLLVKLNEGARTGEIFSKAFNKVQDIFTVVADKISEAVQRIKDAFQGFKDVDFGPLTDFSDKAQTRLSPFTKIGEVIGKAFDAIVRVFEWAAPIVRKLGTIVGSALGSLADTVKYAIENLEFDKILDLLNSGFFAAMILGFKKFGDNLSGITSSAGGFLDNVTQILDGVRGSLEAYQSNLKAKTLITIAGAVAILAGSLLVLSLIDSDKLSGALLAITTLFLELAGTMVIIQKSMGKGNMVSIAGTMLSMAASVAILVGAMTILSKIDPERLTSGMLAIATLSGILVASATILSKSSGTLIKGSTGLVIFASAILVLAQVVKQLGELDPVELTKGLVGVGVLMAELAVFMKVTDVMKSGAGKSVGLVILAGAIKILASAVEDFGKLDSSVLIQGLTAMGVVLVELAAFMKLTGDAKHVISTAIGMTILGGAMLILAEAIARMGSLSWQQIGKGLLTMAGALAAITLSMNLLPKNMISSGLGLIAVAGALVILSGALQTMGSMSWEQIAKGLVTLAGSLVIIATAMHFMTGALPGAAALLIVAASLAILAPVLQTLGSMSLAEIGKGLLAIAGVFAVLGIAALVLAPLVPVILALGGAVILFGIGALAAGAGLLAFSAGLAALAVSGTAGAGALVLIVSSLISLIPFAIEQLGIGLLALADVVIQGAPKISEAFTAIVSAIIEALVNNVPAAIDAILFLLDSLLDKLVEYVPDMVSAGLDLVIGILEGIAEKIDDVVVAAIDIVIAFLDGISSKIKDVIDAGFDLIIAFIEGLTNSIDENGPELIEAIGDLIWELLDTAVQIITAPVKGIFSIGKDLVNGLIEGIKDTVSGAVEAVKGLGESMLNGLKSFLGIHSPSTVARDEIGVWFVKGIAEGITKDMSAEEAATKKAANIVNAFKDAFDSLDIMSTMSSLESDLWTALTGKTADATTVAAHDLEQLNKQLLFQRDKTELALGEYQVTLGEFGADSDTTKKAYNKLLKEQIAFAELANNLADIQQNEAKRNDAAQTEYVKYLEANSANLLGLGFTVEEIQAAARDRTGYNSTKLTTTMASNVGSAVETAMSTVADVYDTKSVQTFGGLLNSFGTWGGEYATAVGDNFILQFQTAMAKIETQLNSLSEKLDTHINTIKSQLEAISGANLDSSPTITPVLDLTNVKQGSKMITGLLTTGRQLAIGAVRSATAISTAKQASSANTEVVKASSAGTSVQLTQINNSPTALSRLDIYRDTKNLLTTVKDMVTKK